MGERAQEGLSGGAMPSVSRAPCWVGFQWVGVEWGTRQLGRRNIQGSKEGWACSGVDGGGSTEGGGGRREGGARRRRRIMRKGKRERERGEERDRKSVV